MKRIFYIVILVALTPTLVNAFGLGNLDLNSALNEPFDARIQLLSPTADELDSLKINLADSQAFARAKVDRPFILSKLKFDLRRSVDDGPDYIRVYSQDPIREPFLNFLIEVSWSNGRLFREYTVLLDPPLYDPNARASEFAQVAKSESSMELAMETEIVTFDDPDHLVTYGEAYKEFAKSTSTSTSSTHTPSSSYTPTINYGGGGDYGPTAKSDTLWSIASEMRPDRSISVNKMMLALLAANPDAFINQNINGLKRGQILRMPNESEMNALSNAEILTEVKSQSGVWGSIRDNLSSAVSERPEVSSVSETSAPATDETIAEEVVVEPELKLVAADDVGEATEQQVSSADLGSGEELVLAEESIQVLTQENMDLEAQVSEADTLLEDLKRLLLLKDDELAALQEQMAVAAAEAEVAAMELAEEEFLEEAEADEEVVEEAEVSEVEEVTEVVEEESAIEEEMEVEEVLEVIETEPAFESDSDGIMGMVNQYIAPIKDFVLANLTIALAAIGTLIALIIGFILLKFRKEPAETVHIDAMTEEFPDFDSGDLGDTGSEPSESEAVTVLPDSEAETALVDDGSAEIDLDLDEEEKTQFMPAEETEELVEEEDDDEDPLQEVNTYLAFEQFDQAEEFVRNVIKDDPDNPEYQTKLLEVFYTSGNKKSYEETAKILHDNVGGEGEHWNMAVAMWQEMSPNRALFAEGGDDEADVDADNTSGFVDVTADAEAGDDSGNLDFDIGGGEEVAVEETTDTNDEMLDVTASGDDEILDITASAEGEDLLDVTAAVGLGDVVDSEAETASPTTADDILDISAASGGDLLDLTAAEELPAEDLLDVTAAGNANLDLDSEEDLLDVTAATSAGADSSTLLDLDIDTGKETESDSNEIEFDVAADTNETVEFDLGNDEPEISADSTDDDNAIDFDMTSGDIAEEGDEPIQLDVEVDAENQEDDISLDFDMGSDAEESSEEGEISLDLDISSDEESSDEEEISLDLDMDVDDDAIELDLSIEEDDVPETAVPEIDFDLSLDEEPVGESVEADFDLDGTVELPKSSFTVEEEDDDDDDDDHTVFVPRAAQPEEQSSEDEIATKLDLAKAYVELGDKDSAKTILDEVMLEGNDEQRQQAEDLLGQI